MYYTLNGVDFVQMPPLPQPLHSHCAVIVDSDKLAVVRGVDAALNQIADVLLYRKSTRTWTNLPPMTIARENMHCGTASSQDGTEVYIRGLN